MSGFQFCPHCGSRLAGTDIRFCGHCGGALPGSVEAPPSPTPVSYPPPPAAGPPPSAPPGAQPPGPPRPAADDYGWDQPPGAGGGPAPASPVRDWAAAAGLSPERLRAGDWAGAARAVLVGVAVMIAFTTVCLLLVGSPGSVGDGVKVIAMLTALAAGGSLHVGTGITSSGTAAGSVSFLPLAITAVGFTTMAVLFVRGLARQRISTGIEVAYQAVRAWLVLLAALLVVCLLGRSGGLGASTGGNSGLLSGMGGTRLSAGIIATLFYGSCWLALALGLAVLARLPHVLPDRLRNWRDVAAGPFAGVVTTLALSWLAAAAFLLVGALIYNGNSTSTGTSTGSGSSVLAVIGGVLLLAPTVLLAVFAFALGVPAQAGLGGSALSSLSGAGLGGLGTGGSISLLDVTDADTRFWVVPVIAALAVLAGGAVTALHAPGPTQARRHGWRFGPALAGLLLTIAVSTAISGQGTGSVLSVGGSISADAHLNYVAAVLLGLLWGAAGGYLGAMVAPALPGPLIASVRGRVARARARTAAATGAGGAPGSYRPPPGLGTRPPPRPATGGAPTARSQSGDAPAPPVAPRDGYSANGGSERYGIHDTRPIPTGDVGPPSGPGQVGERG